MNVSRGEGRRPHRRPATLVLLAALVVTTAGLVWLNRSSALASAGRRIADLQSDRAELLERRTAALLAHARRSDPRVLAERAHALGFGPAIHVTTVPVRAGAPATHPRQAGGDPSGPLAIVLSHRTSPTATPGADPAVLRLMGMVRAIPTAVNPTGTWPR